MRARGSHHHKASLTHHHTEGDPDCKGRWWQEIQGLYSLLPSDCPRLVQEAIEE